MTHADPLTAVEVAEVLLGCLALVYALDLQIVRDTVHRRTVWAFFALGSALVLTHAGMLFHEQTWRVFAKIVGIGVVGTGMTAVWWYARTRIPRETDMAAIHNRGVPP